MRVALLRESRCFALLFGDPHVWQPPSVIPTLYPHCFLISPSPPSVSWFPENTVGFKLLP